MTREKESGWREKIIHELTAYWINVAYLAWFFSVFAWYRRLVLAEYDISYLNYGVALIEALILAKVILLGDALRIGKRMEGKPLIYAALYKTLIFALWVAAFKIVERTLAGLFHGKGLAAGIIEIRDAGMDAMLAESLVVLCAFVPFFAFRELAQVLGAGRMRELFFHSSGTTNTGNK
jgi:hypothetical protein